MYHSVEDVDCEGGHACAGSESMYMGNLCTFSSNCCEPKTFLKNKVYSKDNNDDDNEIEFVLS